MGGKIFVIIILVVVLGFIIYIFNSGLVGKIEQQYNSLRHPSSSSANWFSFPESSSSGSGGTTYYPPSSTSKPATTQKTSSSTTIIGPVTTGTIPGTTSTIYLSQIPAGYTLSQLSPYYHQIQFGGISAGSFYSYGTITLSGNNVPRGTSIDVTGWQIKSNKGGEYVPQAINIYDPSGLTAPGDIDLQSGQYLYMYSSYGAFNLRLNECIGYIGQENHFKPSLPRSCPSPNRSAITSFSGQCQNFINSIGSCQVPNLNNTQIPLDDYACRDYISDNFNYWSCFNAHESDTNFLSNQWWVWMGASPVDQYHDNVYLLDRSGKLVDSYSY